MIDVTTNDRNDQEHLNDFTSNCEMKMMRLSMSWAGKIETETERENTEIEEDNDKPKKIEFRMS